MNADEWATFNKMQDRELLDFVTETEASQRKHAASHLLQMRRNKVMERATMWAAVAAGLSAFAAVVQLVRDLAK